MPFPGLLADELTPSTDFVQLEQKRLEHLFDQLNLEYSGLDRVRQYHEEGELQLAAAALLHYYQERPAPAPLKNPTATIEEHGFRRRADDALLRGIFYSQGTPGRPPPGKNSRFDWSWKGPQEHMEWAWFFNRHYIINDWLTAWNKETDARYAKAIAELIEDWIRANPKPRWVSLSAAWRPLEAARRIGGPWIQAFFRLQHEPAFSPDARLLMLSSLANHGDYLLHHHSRSGNHQISEMTALLKLALAWPEFDHAPRWKEAALNQLEQSLYAQSYPDGAHTELSNHYQIVVLREFQDTLLWMEDADLLQDREAMVQYILKMVEYLAQTQRPSGWGPLNNDSDLENNRKFIQQWNRAFKNPSMHVNFSATENASSIYFPYAGHAVMRMNSSEPTAWAYFDAGPQGTDHRHQDRLHLSVSMGERDFLVDSGRYTYQPGPARDYFRSYRAHNTVSLENRGPEGGPHHAGTPLPVPVFLSPDLDTFRASVRFSPQPEWGRNFALHHRLVGFSKTNPHRPYWVVVDKLISAQPSRWIIRWNFHPDCRVIPVKGTVQTAYSDGTNLAVIPLNAQPELSLYRGRNIPVDEGWHSTAFHQRRPATTALFTLHTTAPATQIWLIVPFHSDTSPRQPDWKLTGESLTLYWADGGTDTIPLTAGSGPP